MEHKPLRWLKVRKVSDLAKIRSHIKAGRINQYSPRRDKNGNHIVLLGWDDKPDSDWGKFRGHSAAIWFANEDLAAGGYPLIEKALGWK